MDRFNSDSPIIIEVEGNGCTTNESVIEEVNELDVAEGSSFLTETPATSFAMQGKFPLPSISRTILDHNEPQGSSSSKGEETTVESNVLNQHDSNSSLIIIWYGQKALSGKIRGIRKGCPLH
nr:unnamed protein product [Callosobruchus analis]